MNQQKFTDIEYSQRKKKTRRKEFLDTMEQMIPWDHWTAMIISAPSSTKNSDGKRDPEMHQTKKGTSGITV